MSRLGSVFGSPEGPESKILSEAKDQVKDRGGVGEQPCNRYRNLGVCEQPSLLPYSKMDTLQNVSVKLPYSCYMRDTADMHNDHYNYDVTIARATMINDKPSGEFLLNKGDINRTSINKLEKVQMFEDKQVRTIWDTDQAKWYVSIIDVIEILTGTDRPRKYWSDLKAKLKKEGSELSENIGQLKMAADDGKMRKTDVADTEQLFRLIQSVPSPKAEPLSCPKGIGIEDREKSCKPSECKVCIED